MYIITVYVVGDRICWGQGRCALSVSVTVVLKCCVCAALCLWHDTVWKVRQAMKLNCALMRIWSNSLFLAVSFCVFFSPVCHKGFWFPFSELSIWAFCTVWAYYICNLTLILDTDCVFVGWGVGNRDITTGTCSCSTDPLTTWSRFEQQFFAASK